MNSSPDPQRTFSLEDLELDDDLEEVGGEGARQFVAFEALGETYGIPLERVVEIAHSIKLTRLPGTPSFISGVVSLRGSIVPVVDLHAKFGDGRGEYGPRSGIIVVQLGSRTIGIRAEYVKRILGFADAEIAPVPSFSSRIRTEFLQGLARRGDDLVIALDIDRLLSEEEIAIVDAQRTGARAEDST